MKCRKRVDEFVDIVADAAVDAATNYVADKATDAILDNKEESEECGISKKHKKAKDEDVETVTPSATPTGSNGTLPVSSASNPASTEDKDEPDPMIEYILQQMQKNKDKQLQDAQMDYVYRQQQANQIVRVRIY